MFLGIRDIAHARGRFALMTTVVGLITLLIVMLSGLTGGLGKQNTSALEALDPTAVVFHGEPSFTESAIPSDAPFTGVPLGTSQTRASAEDYAAGVAVFGLPAGYESPAGTIPEEGVLLPESVATELHAGAGDEVSLGGVGVQVQAVVPDLQYSHSPVVWAPTGVWQDVTHTPALGTVLLTADKPEDQPGYTVTSLRGSFDGLASYKSEQSSLQTMQGFLYAISALVTIAFLTVWTIQRTRDLSILKALGASGSYLFKDAVGQAAVVLAIGAGVGALLGWGLGALAAGAVPFELSWLTVAAPALGIFTLGMGGALLATRGVSKTDPLLALGGNA